MPKSRRKLLAVGIGLLVAFSLVLLPASPATAAAPEGCVLFNPALPPTPNPRVGPSSCSYDPTHSGGYVCAAQTCTIKVTRSGTVITTTATFGGADAMQTTIKASDTNVTASVKNGNLTVGSPDTT